MTSILSLKPTNSEVALEVVGVSCPLEQRDLGTNLSSMFAERLCGQVTPIPMSVSLIYRVAQLRGVNELSVKNPGRLLAQKRCVAQVSCSHFIFFLLEQGRRKQRLLGKLELVPQ